MSKIFCMIPEKVKKILGMNNKKETVENYCINFLENPMG